jgi:spermidine synthase
VSILGLFLEVMLIRWVGTEVRIFAYLQNTILVVCFLGLGLGSFWCHRPIRRGLAVLPVAGFSTLLAVPATRDFLRGLADRLAPIAHGVAWGDARSASAAALLADVGVGLCGMFALMVLLCVGFVPIGQVLGRLLDEHPRPILAYSANVVGSLVGVWGFAALSAAWLPPAAWIAVTVALTVPFLWGTMHAWTIALLASIMIVPSLVGNSDPKSQQVWWSPYQKLTVELVDRVANDPQPVQFVRVNNTGYQAMLDLRPAATRARPDVYTRDWHGTTQYDVPYLLHDHPSDVLIVGAGTGNDVAGALRNGADRIVAVDIDPAIVEIGKRDHPEKPYASDRVRVVVDDARSFFVNDRGRYDVVSFGLLDAHTMTALSNARLDHYVYTRQSIAQAHRLMKPGGVMSLAFNADRGYIADRLAHTLREEFGEPPMVFAIPNTTFGFGAVMFLAGNLEMVRARLVSNPGLRLRMDEWHAAEREQLPLGGKSIQESLHYDTVVATDDWPYVYLERPTVPAIFFELAILVLLLPVVLRRVFRARRFIQEGWGRVHWHFAFLGAAFLLLEVANISKAAVVLGNTWLVSAIIITGVLVMVLLANFIVARWRQVRIAVVSGLLVATCVGLYFVDLAVLLRVPPLARAALVAGITCLPMLFSGVLFISSFASCAKKDEAYGANLLGSLVGGLLQSVTYWSGVKFLLLIVAALYLGAVITRPRTEGTGALT